jgi:carbonic anhydrase
MKPDEALQCMLEGNRRYVAHQPALDASPVRRMEVAAGQKPLAMVLGCVDSRVPPELIFDQGLGDLFVVRTAGEVLDRAALASLEFGVAELGIPLLVVLGHRRCGAIKAAIDVLAGEGEAEADVAYLVEALAPAVEAGRHHDGDLWDEAGRAQVAQQVARLSRAPILAEGVAKGELRVVGAWYDLGSGAVEVLAD